MPDKLKQSKGAGYPPPVAYRNQNIFAPAAKISSPSAQPVRHTSDTKLAWACGMFRTVTGGGSSLMSSGANPISLLRNLRRRAGMVSRHQSGRASRGQASASLGQRSGLREEILVSASIREGGQTLVELMIAMSVMSIGFLAVFAVLSQTLGMNKIVVNQYIAANLAAEGIEIVKNISDSNVVRGDVWNAGLSKNGKFGVQYNTGTLDEVNEDWANRKLPLNFNSDTGIYSYDTGMPTNFVRTITINNISPNEIQVNSEVRWRDRGGVELNINLEDHLFNWHEL